VEFGLTTQRITALTNASGIASVTLTLVDEPTTDTVRASYAGAPGFATSSASAPFTITPSPTTLTLLTTTPTFSSSGQADLRIALTDGFGRPLREKAVLIIVKDGSDTIVFTESVITDLFGNARLLTAPLGTGSYSVSAHFAARVVLPTGVWDTRTARYQPTITPNPANGDPPLTLISNTPPTAVAGGPYVVAEGGSVTLDAAGSSDPDLGQLLSYAWDLNGVGMYESTGVTVTYFATSIDGPNSATVNLQVCDPVADCALDSATIIVENVPPTIVDVTNDGPIEPGQSVLITVDATDPIDTLTYAFDCDNDGIYEIGPQAAPEATCTIAASVDQIVAVKVDDGTETTTGSTLVDVTAVDPPTVDAGSDQSGFVGVPLTFSGVFTDPGGVAPYVISWSFGDGTTAATLMANHTYTAPGVYTAMLTVRNGAYLEGSDTIQVTILPSNFSYCILALEQDVKLDKDSTFTDCAIGAAAEIDIKANVTLINSPTSSDLGPITWTPLDLTAGSQKIKLDKDSTESLTPGLYGKLEIKKDATLILSSGEYSFEEIKSDKGVTWVFDLADGPVIINVVGDIEFDKETAFVVNAGDAGDILFRVAGEKVTIGKDSHILGTFFAPEAEVKLEGASTLTGALYGNNVDIKKDNQVIFQLAVEVLTLIQTP
jgi:PKD repeat protein